MQPDQDRGNSPLPTDATTRRNDAGRMAFRKAEEGQWWRLVSWQADWQCWLVPSRTAPGEWYRVKLSSKRVRSHDWWERLRCDCKAAQAGYAICWHKAAVLMRMKYSPARAEASQR